MDRAGRLVGKYRKVHLPGHAEHEPWRPFQHLEKRYFDVGDLGFPVWRALGGVLGLCICNDRRWPETYRVMGLQGVEMILLGYNTPAHNPPAPEQDALGPFHNHLVMQAGAYQNATWVVGVAKCGREEGCDLIGQSAIIAPSGEIVAQAATLGDELITARCDLDLTRAYKDTIFNFARHRRPEHYRLIVDRVGAEAATRGGPMTAGDVYFEDFTPGREFRTEGITVTEGQIIDFAMAFDPQPFHLDVEAAKATIYEGLIASGFQTMALTFRLFVQTRALAACSLGSPGVDEVRWLRPVRPGDTLRATVQVLEQRPSTSKPDRGIVRLHWTTINQRSEPVLTLTSLQLVRRRPDRRGLSQSAQTSSAEASACSSPLSETIADAPSRLRPSDAKGQPITIHRAPTSSGRIRLTVSWLSTALRRPKASSSAKPVGQSSAAQTNSGRIAPCLSKSVGSGAQGAATRCRPGSGPGKMASPSPHSRAGPQTKHSGNACSVNPR